MTGSNYLSEELPEGRFSYLLLKYQYSLFLSPELDLHAHQKYEVQAVFNAPQICMTWLSIQENWK